MSFACLEEADAAGDRLHLLGHSVLEAAAGSNMLCAAIRAAVADILGEHQGRLLV